MHVYKQLSIHCLFTGYSLWWDQKVILNSHYLCRCGQALWSPSGRSSWRRQRTFPDSAPCLWWSPSCLCRRGLLVLLPSTCLAPEPAWCNTCNTQYHQYSPAPSQSPAGVWCNTCNTSTVLHLAGPQQGCDVTPVTPVQSPTYPVPSRGVM